jgi:hypothetical protein
MEEDMEVMEDMVDMVVDMADMVVDSKMRMTTLIVCWRIWMVVIMEDIGMVGRISRLMICWLGWGLRRLIIVQGTDMMLLMISLMTLPVKIK